MKVLKDEIEVIEKPLMLHVLQKSDYVNSLLLKEN